MYLPCVAAALWVEAAAEEATTALPQDSTATARPPHAVSRHHCLPLPLARPLLPISFTAAASCQHHVLDAIPSIADITTLTLMISEDGGSVAERDQK
jgi:hypothetical protein